MLGVVYNDNNNKCDSSHVVPDNAGVEGKAVMPPKDACVPAGRNTTKIGESSRSGESPLPDYCKDCDNK